MNKYFLILIAILSLNILSNDTYVLDPQRAMLDTQLAKEEIEKFEKSADVVADIERLQLIQTESQELSEKFQKDNETMSEEEKLDIQKKLQDLNNEAQFLVNKLQTKEKQEIELLLQKILPDYQAVLGELIQAKKISLILAPGSYIHAGSDLILTDDVTTALDVRLSKKSESNN